MIQWRLQFMMMICLFSLTALGGQKENAIQGRWVSDCTRVEPQTLQRWNQRRLEIQGNGQYRAISKDYWNSNCSEISTTNAGLQKAAVQQGTIKLKTAQITFTPREANAAYHPTVEKYLSKNKQLSGFDKITSPSAELLQSARGIKDPIYYQPKSTPSAYSMSIRREGKSLMLGNLRFEKK